MNTGAGWLLLRNQVKYLNYWIKFCSIASFTAQFDLTCEGHQNTSKTFFMNVLGALMATKSDLKIDLIMSEPCYVKFFFCKPPP